MPPEPANSGTDDPRRDPADGNTAARAASLKHLTPEELYDVIENRMSRGRLKSAEAHFSECRECVETLAMILKCDRHASREEEQTLATIPAPSTSALIDALRPRIVESKPTGAGRSDWKSVLLVLTIGVLLTSSALWIRNNVYWPASSRRIATQTLNAMVELRQATGRIPLRYITEYERAGVVRSGFDDVNTAGLAMLHNLRVAVDRAPEPEAVLILGLLVLDGGDLDEAEQLLTGVLQARPRSVAALNGLAVVNYERAQRSPEQRYGLLQRGLALLRRAEAADPEDLRVLYNYGKFYEALGMRRAAGKSWARYADKDKFSQWGEEAFYQLPH